MVAVDSIKEGKRLIASHSLSAKIRFLFLVDKAVFNVLNELWQEDLDDSHTYLFRCSYVAIGITG